jgi:O-antigen/teichoic acid export membrane protein
VLQHTLGIKLLWTSGGLVALLISATLLRQEWDVRMACYLIGAALVARSFMFTIRGVLQGLERFGWDSAVVLGDRVLLLVLGTAVLLAGGGLLALSAAFVVARAAALVFGAWLTQAQLGGVSLRYDRKIWGELQRSAVPFGLFLIVLNLYAYIDSVMLGVMRGDVETGVYGAAYKVYEGVGYLPGVVASVLTPRLSSLFMTDRGAHKRLMLTGLIGSVSLALVVGVLGYWLAEPLLVLLFGANFAVAAAPFRILCLGLVFVFAIWTLHAAAISINKERLLLRAALIGLVVNVAANAYAVPHYGASGAAAATVIGEFVSLIVLVIGLL